MLLGLYLAQLGYGAARVGLLVGIGLAGSAVGTAAVTLFGDRLGRRTSLLIIAGLGAAGLAGMALARGLVALGLAAFLGMVNGAGRDRSPAQVLEQSVLADAVPVHERTRAFTWYTFFQDAGGALGSLAAALPAALVALSGLPVTTAYRATFAIAAAAAVIPLVLYVRLPITFAPHSGAQSAAPGSARPGPDSARRVHRLAALFAVDSLGGGFLAGAILAYWFFRRFGLGGDTLGPLFFAARVLNAVSYPVAGWLARRVGLIRTMVFTHLPSSAVLVLVPFLASPALVMALFLLREALVQMDVPARQSYVAAVTEPGQRTYALGITGLVRNVGWAFGPPLAGLAMRVLGLGAPLVLGASIKMAYDVALYRSFKHLPAPEER